MNGQPHGKGTIVFADGDRYVGQFYLGQVNGNGTLITTNGTRCEGRFFNNQLSGRGTCAYPKGYFYRSYNGEFRGGVPEGRGVLIYADGRRYVGELRNGVPFQRVK